LRKKIVWSVFVCLAIVGFIFSSAVDAKERQYIKVGELRSVFTDSPNRISISNPEVADVTSVSTNEILVIGKSPGNTLINIWDKWGKQTLDIDVYLERLSSLKERIEKLLKTAGILEVSLDVNPDEDKIVIRGDIEESHKKHLEMLTDPFKEKLINLIKFEARKTVLIDVNILELDKSNLDKLGIDWTDFVTVSEHDKGGVAIGTPAGPLADIFKIGDWSRTALSATLNMLVNNGEGRVLSRPKLVCLSGEEAEFLVGGEVPIVTTVAHDAGVSVNVEYKEYGISLKIKPTIEYGTGIKTSLTTEVSEIDWANAVTAAGISIPAFLTRETSTEVFIREGQTIFLAGLLKNKDEKTIARVPGIGDIPILGHLFRSRNFTSNQTELVITLTPTIIDSSSPDKFISEVEEEIILIEDEIAEEVTEEEIKAVQEEVSGVKKKEPKLSKQEKKRKLTEELKEPIANYAQLIYKAIQDQFSYPDESRANDESGTVVLSLYIIADGTISDVTLSSSSDFESLDKSAISLVKNITKLEPFPQDIPLKDLWIDIPIEYRLD